MEQDIIQIIITLTVFIIGSLFGSFFTLATYRIPRKQDIWIKRSYCPRCKHNLGFFDCFPIFSYISTVGRCKYCHCYISYRYIITEVVNGFVFMFAYMFFGFSINLAIFLICYIYLFIYIGSSIMETKMTDEEKKEVEKINKAKEETKKNKKNGIINIEIVVATVVFIVYFTSTIYVSRNYKQGLDLYKRKSDALNICMNEAESLKATNMDDIVNSKEVVVYEDDRYSVDVTVSNYMQKGYIENDNAKIVNVKVTYVFLNETKETSISFIKEVEGL